MRPAAQSFSAVADGAAHRRRAGRAHAHADQARACSPRSALQFVPLRLPPGPGSRRSPRRQRRRSSAVPWRSRWCAPGRGSQAGAQKRKLLGWPRRDRAVGTGPRHNRRRAGRGSRRPCRSHAQALGARFAVRIAGAAFPGLARPAVPCTARPLRVPKQRHVAGLRRRRRRAGRFAADRPARARPGVAVVVGRRRRPRTTATVQTDHSSGVDRPFRLPVAQRSPIDIPRLDPDPQRPPSERGEADGEVDRLGCGDPELAGRLAGRTGVSRRSGPFAHVDQELGDVRELALGRARTVTAERTSCRREQPAPGHQPPAQRRRPRARVPRSSHSERLHVAQRGGRPSTPRVATTSSTVGRHHQAADRRPEPPLLGRAAGAPRCRGAAARAWRHGARPDSGWAAAPAAAARPAAGAGRRWARTPPEGSGGGAGPGRALRARASRAGASGQAERGPPAARRVDHLPVHGFFSVVGQLRASDWRSQVADSRFQLIPSPSKKTVTSLSAMLPSRADRLVHALVLVLGLLLQAEHAQAGVDACHAAQAGCPGAARQPITVSPRWRNSTTRPSSDPPAASSL